MGLFGPTTPRSGTYLNQNAESDCEGRCMADNYCPFCGRFLMGKVFEHACDRVNRLRDCREWCRSCGARLDVMQDNRDEALCHLCSGRLDPALAGGNGG
jgi:hypothetical protein